MKDKEFSFDELVTLYKNCCLTCQNFCDEYCHLGFDTIRVKFTKDNILYCSVVRQPSGCDFHKEKWYI